tara:strand:- start:574 stop:1098 length:525 start_codon:yes stop_codon:yes gene_type:complete
MKCKLGRGSMNTECDENGDFRDGWKNCSICGETDWDSLFENVFPPLDVMDLITQDEVLMDKLGDIEAEHFERTYPDMTEAQLLKYAHFWSPEYIARQLSSDEPFAGYLADRHSVVRCLVGSLNRVKRMELFITAHDYIFDTKWREKYAEWQMERATKDYRELQLRKALMGDFDE